MTDAPNAREAVGGNNPPLDRPEDLAKRLEREYADLLAEVSDIEAGAFGLPPEPSTDEEATLVSDHVVAAKKLVKRLEDARTEEGKPYLDAKRIADAWFADAGDLLTDKDRGLIGRLTERVGIYNRAKAARLEADRRAAAAEAERKAEEARQAQRRAQEEADRQARAAEEAQAAIRQAADATARAAAEKQMRDAETAAAAARKAAVGAGKDAAKEERVADQNERAADGATGNLSRVSAGGSTSSVTKVWTHTITDAKTLMDSLGPLGAFLDNGVIMAALARAVREAAAAGRADKLELPGVRVFQDVRTNISARRS